MNRPRGGEVYTRPRRVPRQNYRVRVHPLAALFAAIALAAAATQAERLAVQARKAEKAGETIKAYLLYSEAAAADPAHTEYWLHAQALRPLAEIQSGKGIDVEPPSKKLDPSIFGSISDRELAEARRPLPPAELAAEPGRKDYDLRGDSKSLWEQLAHSLKLLVVFDSGYQPTKPLRFELAQADYRDAIHALQAATDSFATPVGDRLIFVANDTPQKRTDYERTAAVVVPVPETITPQELQELLTAVRGTMEIQRLFADSARRLVVIRDRVAKVREAETLFRQLMRPRPQVAIEIEILTTDNSSALSYGLSLPTSFPIGAFGSSRFLSSLPTGTPLLTFGGGASLIGIGVTSASLMATVTKSSAVTVLRSELLSVDGQAANFHVGDKYPIVTNEYIGSTAGQTGTVFAPPPTFNFEDLGLVLKITPHVHGMDELSLDVSAEYKLLGSTSVDGIPVIVNTKFESKVRLTQGQWAVLTGLMTASDARTISGIPGLMAIPFLRTTTHNVDRGNTLVVLKPHLLSLPPTEWSTPEGWVGTETKPRTEM
jgi:general secretion pathway protein D